MLSPMTQDTEGLVKFVNHLIEEKDCLVREKDGLVREKDELVESKIKLWQAMHQMILEKDARIVELEHANASAVLREENNKLLERNQALEEALRDLLNREDEDGGEEEEEEDQDQDESMELSSALKRERRDAGDPMSPSSTVHDDLRRRPGSARLVRQILLPSPDSDVQSIQATSLPKFSFAPLIRSLDDGTHEIGHAAGLAPTVMQSLDSQLGSLQARVREGKGATVPTQSYSSGCFWAWLKGRGCRWTVLSPREFACANCFNARRACSIWLGNMKYLILPLPPAVRKGEATWQDAEYYISRQARTNDKHYPGVWELSEKGAKK